jgi:hypothetical protein
MVVAARARRGRARGLSDQWACGAPVGGWAGRAGVGPASQSVGDPRVRPRACCCGGLSGDVLGGWPLLGAGAGGGRRWRPHGMLFPRASPPPPHVRVLRDVQADVGDVLLARGARVARRRVNVLAHVRLRELPYQGVFTPAAADDKDLRNGVGGGRAQSGTPRLQLARARCTVLRVPCSPAPPGCGGPPWRARCAQRAEATPASSGPAFAMPAQPTGCSADRRRGCVGPE